MTTCVSETIHTYGQDGNNLGPVTKKSRVDRKVKGTRKKDLGITKTRKLWF